MKGFRTSYHLLASVNIRMNNDNNMGTLYFLYLYTLEKICTVLYTVEQLTTYMYMY